MLSWYASQTIAPACLCHKHQNVALKLRMPTNQDVFCKQVSDEEFIDKLNSLEVTTVKLDEWRQVTIVLPDGKSSDGFDKCLMRFPQCSYVRRVITQYQQIRKLKEIMLATFVTIQMDFAEKYVCCMNEEIQNASFDSQQVTRAWPSPKRSSPSYPIVLASEKWCNSTEQTSPKLSGLRHRLIFKNSNKKREVL